MIFIDLSASLKHYCWFIHHHITMESSLYFCSQCIPFVNFFQWIRNQSNSRHFYSTKLCLTITNSVSSAPFHYFSPIHLSWPSSVHENKSINHSQRNETGSLKNPTWTYQPLVIFPYFICVFSLNWHDIIQLYCLFF